MATPTKTVVAAHLAEFLEECSTEGYEFDIAEVRDNPDTTGYHIFLQASWMYSEDYDGSIFDTLWGILQATITDEDVREAILYIKTHNEVTRETGEPIVTVG